MNKLILILVAFTSLILSAQEKPNIVWIFIDDQGPEWGVYGNELVSTPNLDSIAADGVLYKNAFAVSPVCSPSHTSLFTGTYPTKLGCSHHRSHYIDKLPGQFGNIEEILSANGYFTVNMISEGDNWERILHGASGKTDLNYNRDVKKAVAGQSGARFFDHVHSFKNRELSSYFSGGVWNERKENQPFFAYINIETGKAHGFGYGNKWAKENHLSATGKVEKVPPYLVNNQAMKKKLASIYDSVSYTDVVVGHFLKALKSSGHYENSMIFIAADHGFAIMRHKQTLYDSGLKVPMLIKFPNSKNKGVENRLVSLIDVVPTTLSVAGISVDKYFSGVDLTSGFDRQEILSARDGVDNIFDRSRSVRNSKYRLIVHDYPELPYLNGNYAQKRLLLSEMKSAAEHKLLNEVQLRFLSSQKLRYELYDIENDPFEIDNLADRPEFKEVKETLLGKLKEWQAANGDSFIDYRKNGKPLKANTKVSSLIPK